MDMRCKRRNCCKMCFIEACPFGRCGEPSEIEYPTAKNKCKFYTPQATNGLTVLSKRGIKTKTQKESNNE